MKTITKETILKQGDKEYKAIEVEGDIYWTEPNGNPVAQTCETFEGVPKIELEDEIEKLAKEHVEANNIYFDNQKEKEHTRIGFIEGYKSNQAKYTEEDIRKAFKGGEMWGVTYSTWFIPSEQDTKKAIEKTIQSLNTIKVIEVDDNFKVISY